MSKGPLQLALAVVILAAAATVAVYRFGPKAAPTTVTFHNLAAQTMTLAVTPAGGDVHRLTLAQGAQGQVPYVPGARLDIWPGGDTRPAPVSWAIDSQEGPIEISMDGEALVLSGKELKTRVLGQ
ncbi:MAG: hypothetical protein JSR77_09140 [Planctomycetes bacterium]|nr:hypothetical protein [Planctomycetota bacterium]